VLSRFLRAWAIAGSIALVLFLIWNLIAYRASAEARAALVSDRSVQVREGDHYWLFGKDSAVATSGLLFFPGALVDPIAYAPLARAIAEAGYPALLVQVPRRGVFGGADGPAVFERARLATREVTAVRHWIVAGHSRGGKIAAELARSDPSRVAGLVLIGTTHPRDFSLSHLRVPVAKVYGTRDTVADRDKIEQTRGNLPSLARMVAIDGGNHSQFGHYGFQFGDWPATISREGQQARTRQVLIDMLGTYR
jgi:pimeloyl-ACP methyl ester carboxylesterase